MYFNHIAQFGKHIQNGNITKFLPKDFFEMFLMEKKKKKKKKKKEKKIKKRRSLVKDKLS